MRPEISERSFELAIECALLQHGPDACAGDTEVREASPGTGSFRAAQVSEGSTCARRWYCSIEL